MEQLAIELSGICKDVRLGFKKRRILHDVNLQIPRGEVFGFVGPNGAGKSTTIKVMMGLLTPSAGQAKLFGRDPKKVTARQQVAYVSETPTIYDRLTPYESLSGMLSFHGVKVDQPKQYIMQWLDRMGLAEAAHKPVYKFSKGMAQRTALAQALAVQPKLLVLDEPLSGLDPLGRKLVVDLLADYKAQGGTLFFSSHVLFDVERVADRFGLILNGRLAMVQTPSDIAKRSTEVHIRYFGTKLEEGILEETGGRMRWTVPADAVWASLEQIRNAGGKLVDVQQALTLEALFAKELGQH